MEYSWLLDCEDQNSCPKPLQLKDLQLMGTTAPEPVIMIKGLLLLPNFKPKTSAQMVEIIYISIRKKFLKL